MSNEVQLLAAVYPDKEKAKVTFNMLKEMHKAANITLVDAALISKNDEGKIKIEETAELTVAKGARRGAIITGVLAVIYPPSLLVSLVAGGAIGALAGRIRDTGIKNPKLKEIADQITPGNSAVVVLVDDDSTLSVQNALIGYEGTLVIEVIDEETVKELYKAAEAE